MRKERQELPPVTTHRQCSGQDWVVRGATCLALLREERTLYKRREFDGFSHLERKLSRHVTAGFFWARQMDYIMELDLKGRKMRVDIRELGFRHTLGHSKIEERTGMAAQSRAGFPLTSSGQLALCTARQSRHSAQDSSRQLS